MPRGFLVKRYCKTSSSSSSSSLLQRLRRYSDEDRSDSSSDHDIADGVVYCHGNRPPVSGHANSLDSVRCSSSPTYSKSQDEPLALTTGSNHGRPPLYPLSHSVLYFPRLPEAIPATPPRPKSDQASPLLTPFPPKKRPAGPDNNGHANPAAAEPKPKPPKRPKVVRKLNFDEDKSSPVSGTFIRDVDSDDDLLLPPASAVRRGDIDPSLNVVVITEEARAELAKIENRIGDYVCQLCKEHFPDAFGLAQHRCSRIVHVEYRCPECDKVFNCPANLASHRRWHKPRPTPANGQKNSNSAPRLLPSNTTANSSSNGCHSDLQNVPTNLSNNNKHDGFSTDPSDTESMRDTPSPGSLSNGGEGVQQGFQNSDEGQYECDMCDKKFRRQAYLRKHQQTHLTMAAVVDHDDSASQDDQAINHPFAKNVMLHVSSTSNDGEEASDYSCPSCGVTCLTHHEMEKHALSHHSSEVYPCKYCTSTFYSSAGLTRHINKYHPSENRQVILLQLSSVRPVST